MPDILFSLVPHGDAAGAIVAHPHNHGFCEPISMGGHKVTVLSFSTNESSKTKGRLASFGRNDANDILLPSTIQGQSYKNDHFFFYLAPSTGELILRDLSPRQTSIEVKNVTAAEECKYQLHGTPRVRVIPRVLGRVVHIRFGTSTLFELRWRFHESGAELRKALVDGARDLAATGMTLTVGSGGNSCHLNATPRREGLRSSYAPSAPINRKYDIEVHRYEMIGEGGFGCVFKAVDLRTGDLWAIKEMKPNVDTGGRREMYKKEVEVLHKLRHDHIAQLEHFQGFGIGGHFQLFFRLYEGNLTKILPRHHCLSPPTGVPEWAYQMIYQVSSALDYLHGEDVVHRDIKPANILINYKEDDPLPNFYVADFGLAASVTQNEKLSRAGTWPYLAPEYAQDQNKASDMWAFAVTLGVVLGYWCEREMANVTDDQWQEKQRRFGIKQPHETTIELMTPKNYPDLLKRWHFRLVNLLPALPSAFPHLLCDQSVRYTPFYCCQQVGCNPESFVKRPNGQETNH